MTKQEVRDQMIMLLGEDIVYAEADFRTMFYPNMKEGTCRYMYTKYPEGTNTSMLGLMGYKAVTGIKKDPSEVVVESSLFGKIRTFLVSVDSENGTVSFTDYAEHFQELFLENMDKMRDGKEWDKAVEKYKGDGDITDELVASIMATKQITFRYDPPEVDAATVHADFMYEIINGEPTLTPVYQVDGIDIRPWRVIWKLEPTQPVIGLPEYTEKAAGEDRIGQKIVVTNDFNDRDPGKEIIMSTENVRVFCTIQVKESDNDVINHQIEKFIDFSETLGNHDYFGLAENPIEEMFYPDLE